jgi:hypothetical protein
MVAINQQKVIRDSLARFNLSDGYPVKTPMVSGWSLPLKDPLLLSDDASRYRSMVGTALQAVGLVHFSNGKTRYFLCRRPAVQAHEQPHTCSDDGCRATPAVSKAYCKYKTRLHDRCTTTHSDETYLKSSSRSVLRQRLGHMPGHTA